MSTPAFKFSRWWPGSVERRAILDSDTEFHPLTIGQAYWSKHLWLHGTIQASTALWGAVDVAFEPTVAGVSSSFDQVGHAIELCTFRVRSVTAPEIEGPDANFSITPRFSLAGPIIPKGDDSQIFGLADVFEIEMDQTESGFEGVSDVFNLNPVDAIGQVGYVVIMGDPPEGVDWVEQNAYSGRVTLPVYHHAGDVGPYCSNVTIEATVSAARWEFDAED